ncbi:hypothetical protein [Aliiroseovarius sp.]|uniref:hypothetical protein n=1 Tax=Aliiroseovarius sp. TaxID=1872442 RepID=UPI00261CB6F9|nr:hypothetical protein [Aliiroseovarius sp.]
MMIDMANRIRFDEATETVELDFSNLFLGSGAEVDALYDQIEAQLEASAWDKWFVLLNVTGLRVDSFAWVTQSRRGKALTKKFSMGTVKLDDSDMTRDELARTAGTEAFNPNLFADRDAALARIAELPSVRLPKLDRTPQYAPAQIAARLRLDDAARVAEIDLSGLSLRHSGDVNVVYDTIAELLAETGRKWFFLINTQGLSVEQTAWLSQSRAAKRLRLGFSLGQVRYGAAALESDQVVAIRPLHSRAEAVAELDALRAQVA